MAKSSQASEAFVSRARQAEAAGAAKGYWVLGPYSLGCVRVGRWDVLLLVSMVFIILRHKVLLLEGVFKKGFRSRRSNDNHNNNENCKTLGVVPKILCSHSSGRVMASCELQPMLWIAGPHLG